MTCDSIMQLEEDFGFAIPETDAEGIGTVRQAVAYIEKCLAEKNNGREEDKA